jgi:paired amphipathic helix protein Sin3a
MSLQWVSIPIGSEESYSFKHMRKNQYEEALFKVCVLYFLSLHCVLATNSTAMTATCAFTLHLLLP